MARNRQLRNETSTEQYVREAVGDLDAIAILRRLYQHSTLLDCHGGIYGGDVLYDARQYLQNRQRYEQVKNRIPAEVL